MKGAFAESVVEQAALGWLETSGWQIAHGPEIAPEMPAAERADYDDVVLTQRLCDAPAPKLISGALRVEDATRFIERATE